MTVPHVVLNNDTLFSLYTRIRNIKNEDITVPNATVLSSSTINYSANARPDQPGLILHTTVTIGYDTPWKKMHQALLDAADRTEHPPGKNHLPAIHSTDIKKWE